MNYIKWENSLLIHVSEIDLQHKRLFLFTNKLHKQLLSGKGENVLAASIKVLVQYAVDHFASEESYMHSIQYPDLPSHKIEHEKFVGKINEFIHKYQQNKPLLYREILLFLGSWYYNHILECDKKIGIYNNSSNNKLLRY